MIKQSVMNHFEIDRLGYYTSATYRKYKSDLAAAIKANEMIALVGGAGMGKSFLLTDVLSQLQTEANGGAVVVNVRNPHKEKLNIAGILNAILMDITDEKPRRSVEARTRQAGRIMGKLFTKHRRSVVVVIEEAHRIHYNVLRALKELREYRYNGVDRLFSVVLLGHEQLGEKLERRKEVYWRSMVLDMCSGSEWMSFQERVNYIRAVYGEAIEPEAREKIAVLKHAPQQINFFLSKALEDAKAAGYSRLSAECIDSSPGMLMNALGLSNNDVKRIAADMGQNIGTSTVSEVRNGKGSARTNKIVADALRRAEELERRTAV